MCIERAVCFGDVRNGWERGAEMQTVASFSWKVMATHGSFEAWSHLLGVCVEGTVKGSKVVKFIKVVGNTKTIMNRR